MSAELLVGLLLIAGFAVTSAVLLVIWRATFRDLYPGCTCWVCGRRRQ